MVSLAASKPVLRMSIETASPSQPSIGISQIPPMMVPARTAVVATASLRESAAVASIAAESIALARVWLKWAIQSFTRTDAARMTAGRRLKVTPSGVRIFPTELVSSSYPIIRMINETISPAMYSIRPWPKGCSKSGFRPAIRKPISVTIEEAASERLLRASAVIAIEPESRPETSFPANRQRFKKIPTAPDIVPYPCRTSGEWTSSGFLTNRFVSHLIKRKPLFPVAFILHFTGF